MPLFSRKQITPSLASRQLITHISLDEGLKKAKAVLIVTEHSDVISELKSKNLVNLPLEVLVDGRNCLKSEDVRSQGVLYSGIGRK